MRLDHIGEVVCKGKGEIKESRMTHDTQTLGLLSRNALSQAKELSDYGFLGGVRKCQMAENILVGKEVEGQNSLTLLYGTSVSRV